MRLCASGVDLFGHTGAMKGMHAIDHVEAYCLVRDGLQASAPEDKIADSGLDLSTNTTKAIRGVSGAAAWPIYSHEELLAAVSERQQSAACGQPAPGNAATSLLAGLQVARHHRPAVIPPLMPLSTVWPRSRLVALLWRRLPKATRISKATAPNSSLSGACSLARRSRTPITQ
ncbi:hypothetical protein BC831DRAFT_550229, partial [Entophlyctis helioformis]